MGVLFDCAMSARRQSMNGIYVLSAGGCKSHSLTKYVLRQCHTEMVDWQFRYKKYWWCWCRRKSKFVLICDNIYCIHCFYMFGKLHFWTTNRLYFLHTNKWLTHSEILVKNLKIFVLDIKIVASNCESHWKQNMNRESSQVHANGYN